MIKYRQLCVKKFSDKLSGGSNEEKSYLVSAQLIRDKRYVTRLVRLIEQFIDNDLCYNNC